MPFSRQAVRTGESLLFSVLPAIGGCHEDTSNERQMNQETPLSVAVPWSMSSYIPLHGFHPMYRALFDHVPAGVRLYAWDNVKLHRRFTQNRRLFGLLSKNCQEENSPKNGAGLQSVTDRLAAFWQPSDRVLMDALEGDIEFHHTAPFPSLKRPYVFHCESFSPLFSPCRERLKGEGNGEGHQLDYYRSVLQSPLCLGIFSHVPETLQKLSRCFASREIDRKLFASKIGLSSALTGGVNLPPKSAPCRPLFLFLQPDPRNSEAFFHWGGHIVLRFWQEFTARKGNGFLLVCGCRPDESSLRRYSVDTSFLKEQIGQSLLWWENQPVDREIMDLIAQAHFFLSPSPSLHSVFLMQAMISGTVPVVQDTAGLSIFLQDGEHGIVLPLDPEAERNGDETGGGLTDRSCRTRDAGHFLATRMTRRILALLEETDAYRRMSERTLLRARQTFCGNAFSMDFWYRVQELYRNYRSAATAPRCKPAPLSLWLQDSLMADGDWGRVFGGPVQPVIRIDAGEGAVWEWAGAFLHVRSQRERGEKDWSGWRSCFQPGFPSTTLAYTVEELAGKYLYPKEKTILAVQCKWTEFLSHILRPYPKLHAFAAAAKKRISRLWSRFFRSVWRKR